VEAFLKECHPIEADEENIVLAFKYPFHKDSVDNPKNRALVEESFGKVLAHAVHVRCTLVAKEGQAAAGVVLKDKAAPVQDDAVVKAAAQMFGAEVVAVEKTPSAP